MSKLKERHSVAELSADARRSVTDTANHIRSSLPEPVEKYTLTSLIIMFFAFSAVGWLWEVVLYFIENGVLVNKGTLWGPWLPIYGTGGVLCIILLKKAYHKPYLVFILATTVCTGIEYFTSWYLEYTRGERFWDYSNYFLNINGRVCISGAVIFGLDGCAGVYLLGPFFAKQLKKVPMQLQITLCIILSAAFIGDNVYSHFNPHIGEGISDYKAAAELITDSITWLCVRMAL